MDLLAAIASNPQRDDLVGPANFMSNLFGIAAQSSIIQPFPLLVIFCNEP